MRLHEQSSIMTKHLFQSVRVLSRFVALSFALTLMLLGAFLFQLDKPDSLFSLMYVATIPLYYYLLVFILVFVLLPLQLVPFLGYLVIVPKFLVDAFLLADIFVFKVYRFHIDMLFVDMAINDFGGFGVSWTLVAMVTLAFLAVLVINVFLYRKARQPSFFSTAKLNAVLLLMLLLGQGAHAWAHAYSQEYITQYTPYFPYYLPVTASRRVSELERSFPGIVPEAYATQAGRSGPDALEKPNAGAVFNYPKQAMQCNAASQNKPNILFIVLESWRADMLRADVTPNIARLAETSYQYDNHFSGGSVTVSGLFTLMYGLHPSYLKHAQSAPYKYQTVLTRSLDDMGYSVEAYTSSNLDRFALKPMLFGDIAAESYVNHKGNDPVEDDRRLVSELIGSLEKSKAGSPWFKFVFLTSSHHNYKYPAEFEKFKPVPANSEAFLFKNDADRQPFLNDYQNSLQYVDALFGEIRAALIQTGLDKRTVIVVTSDHGEEFNENGKGYWGHGSNFTRHQTQVPLVLHLPGQNKSERIGQRSGHVDVVSTLLTHVLGCENALSDYSSGENLLALPGNRGLLIHSYKDKAYLIDNKVFASGLFVDNYDIGDIKTKYRDYAYGRINAIRKAESHFLH